MIETVAYVLIPIFFWDKSSESVLLPDMIDGEEDVFFSKEAAEAELLYRNTHWAGVKHIIARIVVEEE